MKRIILFSLVLVYGCYLRITPKVEVKKNNNQNNSICNELDTILKVSWKIGNSLHSNYFHYYEKNDTLVNIYIVNKFKSCLIGQNRSKILKKFKEPTINDLNNIYYEFLSTDKTEPYCLKFWIVADTVQSLKYEHCDGF
jgi:hypothetical protein